jgi:hypothetical protein
MGSLPMRGQPVKNGGKMPKFYSELQEASLENLASDPSGTVAGRVWHNTTEVRVKTDDGTNKRALLRNDQKCVIGNNGTAANNIRLHRGASGVIQFVQGGDSTAEGTLSTALNQISGRVENYTNAGKPAAANAGRLVWLTDLGEVKVDTGATYDNLLKFDSVAPTTTKGDLITRNSSTNIRVAVGTDGQVLKADSTQAAGIKWDSAVANLAVRSVTTTDSPTTADDVLLLSGASFTVTLFTAVGNTGKVLELVHDGTSLTQVYTLATTSGQTVGGVASGSYVLHTNGERLKIISDGSNWKILKRNTTTTRNDYTPTFTGFGTASNVDVDWWRQGDFIYVRGIFTSGTATATEARISLPGSLATPSTLPTRMHCGVYYRNSTGGTATQGGGPLLIQPSIGYVTISSRNMFSDSVKNWETFQDGNANFANGDEISFEFSVPVNGWQP